MTNLYFPVKSKGCTNPKTLSFEKQQKGVVKYNFIILKQQVLKLSFSTCKYLDSSKD